MECTACAIDAHLLAVGELLPPWPGTNRCAAKDALLKNASAVQGRDPRILGGLQARRSQARAAWKKLLAAKPHMMPATSSVA